MKFIVEDKNILAIVPDDVLLEIFAFLSLKDRCNSQRTARRWQILMEDASLWQRINISKEKSLRRGITNRVFRSLLEKHGNSIKQKNVKGCARLTDDSLTAIARFCPNLETLNVNGCFRMTHYGLTRVAVRCAKIQAISLFMTGAKEQTCHAFLLRGILNSIELPDHIHCGRLVHELINRSGKLRGLSVHDVMPFADDNEATITNRDLISLSKRFPMIEKFRLDWCCNITDAGLNSLAEVCGQLNKIHLRECHNISREGIVAIITKCKNLENLILENLFFRRGRITIQITTGLSMLKKLKISDVSFAEHDLVSILALPSKLECAVLENTTFMRQKVSDDVLKTLAAKCKGLKHLRMDTMLDIRSVMDHVCKMKRLEQLFVCCTDDSGPFDQDLLVTSCARLQTAEFRYRDEIREMQKRSDWSVQKKSHVFYKDNE